MSHKLFHKLSEWNISLKKLISKKKINFENIG